VRTNKFLIFEQIQRHLEVALIKNLSYDRLFLSKDFYEELDLKTFRYNEMSLEIHKSQNDKNYLMNSEGISFTSADKRRLGQVEAFIFGEEFIKEINLNK